VISETGGHRRGALLDPVGGAFDVQRPHRPAEVVAEADEVAGRVVDVPLLREFEKQYVFLVLREFCPRSVPLSRSTKEVLTVELAVERSSIALRSAAVPKTSVRTTLTTRPFFRVFFTVA
jgi:hypothetical protein